MSFSINTNASSLSALQVLRATQEQKQANQTAINTGLKIASAKDNAAVYSIAQKLREGVAGFNALRDARNREQSALDVTLVGIDLINDQLLEMKELAAAAADPGLDEDSRAALAEKYRLHRDMIDRIAQQASFQGTNFIDGRHSNFLTYGPNPATIGPSGQTAFEPQPGQTVDLTFDFVGGGKQEEEIEGTVAYYYRWQDTNGSWHNDDGSKRYFIGATDVNGNTLTPDGVPYTTPPVAWTVPDIPNAIAFEAYAEWGIPADAADHAYSFQNAFWPAEDNGIAFNETFADGTHHTILTWNDYNSEDAERFGFDYSQTPAVRTRDVHTFSGFSVVPGDGTANQTDGGDAFSVDMQIVAPSKGVDQFGATVDLYYEWQDENGVWTRTGTPLDSAIVPTTTIDPLRTTTIDTTDTLGLGSADTLPALDNHIDLADLSFSGTIPTVGGTIAASRIVADVNATHDGQLIEDTTLTRQNNLDYQLTSYTGPENQTVNGVTAGSFVEALDGGVITASVTLSNPDPSITTFGGSANAYLEYFDGSSWNRVATPLATDLANTGTATTPISFNFLATLPPVNDTVEQARIVAEFDMVHDGVSQPTETKTLALWDGSTVSAQPTSTTTLISWSENAIQHTATRSAEFATKLYMLDQASGENSPIRTTNLRINGPFGLPLGGTDLTDATAAQDIISRLTSALDEVQKQNTYFAAELRRVERMMNLEATMTDVFETGIGNLVDADMAKESAKFQALQVKEQLGVQALSIANNASGLILSLFNRS